MDDLPEVRVSEEYLPVVCINATRQHHLAIRRMKDVDLSRWEQMKADLEKARDLFVAKYRPYDSLDGVPTWAIEEETR